MGWVRVAATLALLLGAAGCTRPNDEFESPFLSHRGVSAPGQPPEDDPDGGLPVYPVDTPDNPGKPVD